MEKLFNWIGDLFTKIWKVFKKILPYIMIALAVFFTFGGSLVLFGMVLEGYAAAVAAMGLSFLVAPDETIDTVTGVADSVGEAAGSVVGAVAGGVATGLFGEDSSWILIAALAVGAYFLLTSDGGKGERIAESKPRIGALPGEEGEDDQIVVGSIYDSVNGMEGVII